VTPIDSLGGGFSLRDLIDILLVAGLLYVLIQFIRTSIAYQVLKGLLPLGILVLGAVWFDLRTLTWITERLVPVFLLSAVVLFQPEIRRGLARLGARSFGLRFEAEEERVLEAVVGAASALSERSHGAIIVLARETPLDPLAETGTRLDAEVSRDLLETIFQPRTPLHDGAVILRGTRLVAAGCILPLAHDEALARELGTRHRAAIGVTRETDAVAVAISEESGRISLAVGGQLVKNLDAASLREMLVLYTAGEGGK